SAVSSSTRGRFWAYEAANPRFSPEKQGLDALINCVHFSRSAAGRIFFARRGTLPARRRMELIGGPPGGGRATPRGRFGRLSLCLWPEEVLINSFDGLRRRFLTRSRRLTVSAQKWPLGGFP